MTADGQDRHPGRAMDHHGHVPRAGLIARVMKSFGRVNVPLDHVGILRRRFGPADPAFQRVSSGDHRGWQARTLRSGAPVWLPFGRYHVEFVRRIHVRENEIGLVTAQEGSQRPRGRQLGRDVECNSFQDGQAFLLGGGEQGRQVAVLAGGQSYSINTRLFHVECVPRTYVPVGTIGLVIALDGKRRTPGRQLAPHVECDSFQDGQAFLDGGGEQGKQLAVLAGGAFYDINPALFAVITVDNVEKAGTRDGLTQAHLTEFAIKVGRVGVVVTLDGAPNRGSGTAGPRVEGHQGYRLPWVFLDGGGHKGVQEQTLSEGSVCALNPWFVRVVLIPTHQITLEWSKSPAEKTRNYDAQLTEITVTVQGYPVHIELSQVLQIPDRAAPLLVSVFGVDDGSAPLGGLVDDRAPVQRFVEKVLGGTVKGYLSGMAASSTVQEFLGKYEEARRDLSEKVVAELREWHVEPGATSLGRFESKEPKLNAALQAAADAEARIKVVEAEAEIAQRQAEARGRVLEVEAESAKKQAEARGRVLEVEAESAKKQAEARGRVIAVEGENEKKQAEARGRVLEVEAEKARKQAEARGRLIEVEGENEKKQAEARGKVLEVEAESAKTQAEIAATKIEINLREDDPLLWSQVRQLGKEDTVRLRIFESLSEMDVPKIVNGGADLGTLLPLHSFLRELIDGEKTQRPGRNVLNEGEALDVEVIDGGDLGQQTIDGA